MAGLIWAIVVVLFVIWLLSFFAFHITGGFIHVLIVIAIILLVYNLVTGRGARL